MTFKKGNTANVSGISAKQKRLQKRFYLDAMRSWKIHGHAALEHMATNRPAEFCRLVAGMMPQDYTIESSVTHTHRLSFAEVVEELGAIAQKIGDHNLAVLPHHRVLENDSEINDLGCDTVSVDD